MILLQNKTKPLEKTTEKLISSYSGLTIVLEKCREAYEKRPNSFYALATATSRAIPNFFMRYIRSVIFQTVPASELYVTFQTMFCG